MLTLFNIKSIFKEKRGYSNLNLNALFHINIPND